VKLTSCARCIVIVMASMTKATLSACRLGIREDGFSSTNSMASGFVEQARSQLLGEVDVEPGPVARLVFEAERRGSAVGPDNQFAPPQDLGQLAAPVCCAPAATAGA